MPKIDAAIFKDVAITPEQETELTDLSQAVQTLVDNEAETSEIKAAYEEFIEACFDLRQYERTEDSLNYLKESQADLTDSEQGVLHRRFGVLAYSRKDMEVANDDFEKGLELAKAAEDSELEAKLLCDLGNIAAINEEYDEATELYESAIELNEENELDVATPFFNLGLIYLQNQNLGEAADCFEAALEIFTEEEDEQQKEEVHLQLGSIYFAQGDLNEALLNYHYATGLQEENSERLGKTYVSMVSILLKMGQNEKAIEYYEKALPILIQSDDIEIKSEHYFQIGNLYSRYMEDFGKAIECYENSLAIAKTDTENEEWRDLMVAKLEDSIQLNSEHLSKANKKQSKKSGFFGRLFGK